MDNWFTSTCADGHLIRKRADAVMIGTRTTLLDNPSLDARDISGQRYKQPLRVVMGETDIPSTYKVCGLGTQRDPENYMQVYTYEPRVLLDELYSRGVRHLMIEGGYREWLAYLPGKIILTNLFGTALPIPAHGAR